MGNRYYVSCEHGEHSIKCDSTLRPPPPDGDSYFRRGEHDRRDDAPPARQCPLRALQGPADDGDLDRRPGGPRPPVRPEQRPQGALLGMLPFASVLAIVALGQTLVVQQGGIDLSVPGAVSLVVVIATHNPNEDDGRLLRAVLTVSLGDRRGPAQRRAGRPPRAQPDRRHARHERAALRRGAGLSGGIPRPTTGCSHDRRRPHARHPQRRVLRRRDPRRWSCARQEDGRRPSLRGRGRQPAARGRPACGTARTAAPPTSGRRSSTGSPASCSPASSTSRRPTRATPTCCRRSPPSCSAAPRCSAAGATRWPPSSPRCS